MENFPDHLRPSVKEIGPAVLDLQMALRALALSLLEEHEIAAVIQIPHDRMFGKFRRIAER